MIAAAKIHGLNLRRANEITKLVMDHGLHLDLFKISFVNNVRIDKDKAMDPKEKIPPPLVLSHPVVNLVHIPKLITEFNQVCIMIVCVVNIKTKKLSITYHFCFGSIHLPCFLNPFNEVATHQEKINSLCFINRNINKNGQLGEATRHRRLHCYPTKEKMKDK